MADAKLIKALEKRGFYLAFPDYRSNEEKIVEILKEKDERIRASLVLFLSDEFDYKKIKSKISLDEKKELDKSILISQKAYNELGISNSLHQIINDNGISGKFTKSEFEYYFNVLKEARLMQEKDMGKEIEMQSKLRLDLDLNKSLKVLFSPAKVRIMGKIFNHENLTNTELKYYYKAISNINKAVLNPGVQDYLRTIENSKKRHK